MTVEKARANLRAHNLSDDNIAAIEALIDAKLNPEPDEEVAAEEPPVSDDTPADELPSE